MLRSMEPTTRNIAVYARVRPTSNPSDRLAWSTDDRSIRIHVPKDAASGLINNTRDEHVFHFDGVLGPDDPQDHVRPAALTRPPLTQLHNRHLMQSPATLCFKHCRASMAPYLRTARPAAAKPSQWLVAPATPIGVSSPVPLASCLQKLLVGQTLLLRCAAHHHQAHLGPRVLPERLLFSL